MPYYPVENTHKALFPGAGKFHMPIIKPETDIRIDKLEWIPFDKIQKTKPSDRAGQGVHFYCVDRAFEAVWRTPDRYIPLLQQFGAVCSPDFSMYRDHPEAVQIWSMYKRHWLAAYWQMHCIKVIPTIEWVWPESYEWCFDGEPRNAIVSISSCGCMNEKLAKTLFTQGCKEAIRRLNPTQVLWYGKPLPDMDFNATIIKSEYSKVIGRYYDGGSGAASKGSYGGMAALKGSDKQVAWARDLRHTANDALDEQITFAKSPAAISKFGEVQAKEAVKRANRVKKVINSTESSGAIIEAFGSYIGRKTGQQARQAAMSAISAPVRLKEWKKSAELYATSDLYKRLQKAWTGK